VKAWDGLATAGEGVWLLCGGALRLFMVAIVGEKRIPQESDSNTMENFIIR
jgi:hypothetical protein